MKPAILPAIVAAAVLSGCPEPRAGCERDNGGCDPHARCVQQADALLCICDPSHVGTGYACTSTGLQPGAPWPAEGGNAARTGQSIHLGPRTGPLVPEVATLTAGYTLSPPAVGADGTVYVGGELGTLFAIRPDGTTAWSFQGGPGGWSTPAIAANGMLYVAGLSAGALYAFDTTTASGDATAAWSLVAGDLYRDSAPVVGADGTIYVAGQAGRLYAIDPDAKVVKWSFEPVSCDWTSPALGPDGTLYVGVTCYAAPTYSATLYALDPDASNDAGRLVWSHTTSGWISHSPVIGPDGTVYALVTDADHPDVFAFDPRPPDPSGRVIWQWALPGGSAYSSTLGVGADGTVYVAGADRTLYALDSRAMARGGTAKKWSFPVDDFLGSPAIGADGTVYVADWHHLYAIEDGTLVWSYPPADLGSLFAYATPAIAADGTVWVAGSNGDLHAFRR